MERARRHGSEHESAGPERDPATTPYLVGGTGDRAELDADRLADAALERLVPPDTTDLWPAVRRSPTAAAVGEAGGPAPAEVGRTIDGRRGNGRPLESSQQRRFSDALGRSVAGVRIHTDQTAGWLNQQLGAEAFTVDRDVYFSPGSFRPGTPAGDHLIAHELAHTLEPRPTVQRRPIAGAGTPVIRRHGGIGPKLTGAIPKSQGAWDRAVDTEMDDLMIGLPPEKAQAQAEAIRWFRDKLVRYVVVGLGAEGAGFTTSEQRHEMRAQLKEWGLDEVHTEVEKALANVDAERKKEGARPLLATEKEHAGFAAKQKAHSKMKKSLSGSVEKAARTIVDEAMKGIDPGKDGLDKADFLKALRAAKGQVRQRKQDLVRKTEPAKRDDKQAAIDERDMRQSVEAGVAGIGKQALDDVIAADSVEGGMGKLGKLLDAVLPNAGDSCAVSVTLTVPVYTDGGGTVALEIGVSGSAARGIDGAMTAGVPVFGEPRRLEVRGDLAVKLVIKGEIPKVLSVESKVGVTVFARAGADTTALALKALSYGGYRRLSAVNDDLANVWATGHLQRSDQSSGERMHEAESWAAMVEEQAFKEGNAFSHVGGTVSSEIKFTAGAKGLLAFEITGKVGVSTFQKYDEGSLRRSMNRATELEKRLAGAIGPGRDAELARVRKELDSVKAEILAHSKKVAALDTELADKKKQRDRLESRAASKGGAKSDGKTGSGGSKNKASSDGAKKLEKLEDEILDLTAAWHMTNLARMKADVALEDLEDELETAADWSATKDSLAEKSDLFAMPVGTPERAKRRRRHAHGEWGQAWSASLAATVPLPEATLNLGFNASGNFSGWGVEVTAGFGYGAGSDKVVEKIVAGMVPALAGFVKTGAGLVTKKSKAAKAGHVGEALSNVPQMINAQLENQIQTGMAQLSSTGEVVSDPSTLAKLMDADTHTPMFSAQSTAEVAILIGQDDDGALTLRLEIRSGKKIEFTFEAGIDVSASYESKQRIFALGLDPSTPGSKVNAEVMGARLGKSQGNEALGRKPKRH